MYRVPAPSMATCCGLENPKPTVFSVNPGLTQTLPAPLLHRRAPRWGRTNRRPIDATPPQKIFPFWSPTRDSGGIPSNEICGPIPTPWSSVVVTTFPRPSAISTAPARIPGKTGREFHLHSTRRARGHIALAGAAQHIEILDRVLPESAPLRVCLRCRPRLPYSSTSWFCCRAPAWFWRPGKY